MIWDADAPEKLYLCGDVLNDHTVGQLERSHKRLEQQLEPIIQQFCDIWTTNLCRRKTVIPRVISGWMTLQTEQNKKNESCGHLFNPLALIPIGETTHSRLLGDLLDPNGTHGQGRRLLHAFLDGIDVPDPTAGDWMISIEQGGVDICLWRRAPASVIIIENKSNNAVDQPNQLYRYWHENIYKPYPNIDYSLSQNKKAYQVIYLPTTAEKLPTSNSLQRPEYLDLSNLPKTLADVGITVKICAFRDHITAWLNHCDKLVPSDNLRLRTHLQFYKELWT